MNKLLQPIVLQRYVNRLIIVLNVILYTAFLAFGLSYFFAVNYGDQTCGGRTPIDFTNAGRADQVFITCFLFLTSFFFFRLFQ